MTLTRALADNEATLLLHALLSELDAVRWRDGASKVVNCTTFPDTCAQHDVTSFPAIRLYQRGQSMIRYRGARKASCITSFLRRIKQPAVTRLHDETLDAFASSDSVVFIAHLGRGGDSSTATRLSSLADAYRDRYSFGIAQGSPSDPSVLRCYNNEDGMQHQGADLDQLGALEALLEVCVEPLIPEMSRRNELKYTQASRSIVYFLSSDTGEREAYVAAMRPLAKRLREYLQFVTVDSGEFPDMSHALGVAANRGLVVENLHTGQVYPFRAAERELRATASAQHRIPTPDAVEDFITAIAQGQIEPWNGRYDDGEESMRRRDGATDASRHEEL
ncbi:Protein disulfide-isomerase [Purpureocillium takamizusanense]|uniref:Protein disulfide-isomerase n=1 Tax=Purpureocillium takamizusanense TaxID=2060973 RepID=A0A9Q8QIP1_9HYPO|nr:Protein disulfide-isomerase [Purpureocillium takamizusanense]UNI19871.1 Protein disulfide-isomerase [Purpureocillium takamizusanense]